MTATRIVNWLGWWLVCLLLAAVILTGGLIGVVILLSGVMEIIDKWPEGSFICVLIVIIIAMAAVIHKK